MLGVAEALARVLALMAPVGTERVALAEAGGRVLAEPAVATRDQPPFDATAMDGYAVRAADATEGAALRVVGEAPAGRRWPGRLGAGEAVRIFTGAPMPDGADAVLIQEDAERAGEAVRCRLTVAPGAHVRRRGLDFAAGAGLAAPRRLTPEDVALLASMNVPAPLVRRRPRVAILPTGDELVAPGETPAEDQIVASNNFGLAALLAACGAAPDLRPVARDDAAALAAALEGCAGADLIVTLGGASVGDYDLVRAALGDDALAFYKVAMRPGKPLMAGRFRGAPVVGLPGNPVSAMVCGHIFLRPALDALLGLQAGPLPRRRARLAVDLDPGGPREHYMRARLSATDGELAIEPFRNQDSSVLSLLSEADALLVQPPHAPAQRAGALAEFIPLR
jgi:molybdopterin molybdotransferase